MSENLFEANITQYTRSRNGRLNGCLVAGKVGSDIRIGFSKCKRYEVFVKKFGRDLATARMNKYTLNDMRSKIPTSMFDSFVRFEYRAKQL